jgi:hypothetical protein
LIFRFFVFSFIAILRPILRPIFAPYLYICSFFSLFRFKPYFSASFLIFSVWVTFILPRRKVAVSLQRKRYEKRLQTWRSVSRIETQTGQDTQPTRKNVGSLKH